MSPRANKTPKSKNDPQEKELRKSGLINSPYRAEEQDGEKIKVSSQEIA